MPQEQDIGGICLKTIASIRQADDSETTKVEGGFDCSPGSHVVRVRAFRHDKSPAENRWCGSVETDCLAVVPTADIKFAKKTAAFCSVATSTYSMKYTPMEIFDAARAKTKIVAL